MTVSLLCVEFLVTVSGSIMWMTIWKLMISNGIMSAFHLVSKYKTVTSVLLTMRKQWEESCYCMQAVKQYSVMIWHADFSSNNFNEFHYTWRKFMPVKCYPNVAYFNYLKSVTNPPKPRGYFTYHQVYHSTILCSAHALYLCVLCGSQNKQRLFPYTALTGRFL